MSTPNLLQVREVEITYKNHPDLLQRPKIESAKDVANIMRDVGAMQKNIDYKELFYAIYLNQNGRVLSVGKVSEGTAKYCLINTRQI
jgi:DNA repair protein RadC